MIHINYPVTAKHIYYSVGNVPPLIVYEILEFNDIFDAIDYLQHLLSNNDTRENIISFKAYMYKDLPFPTEVTLYDENLIAKHLLGPEI